MKRSSIFLLVGLFYHTGQAHGQQLSQQELLMKYEWYSEIAEQKGYSSVYTYSNNEETGGMTYQGNTITVIKQYYLSDTPDKVFDQSKVGKFQNGKYLIAKNDKIFSCFEILELNNTIFKIKKVADDSTDGIVSEWKPRAKK